MILTGPSEAVAEGGCKDKLEFSYRSCSVWLALLNMKTIVLIGMALCGLVLAEPHNRDAALPARRSSAPIVLEGSVLCKVVNVQYDFPAQAGKL